MYYLIHQDKDMEQKMTYSVKAEEIKNGWVFIITGGFDGSDAPAYHNKKVKISILNMQSALEKALKQLNLLKYKYSLTTETLADKQAEIDFFRKPIPKLFKKLEAEFLEHNGVYFDLIGEHKIQVSFSFVLIDLDNKEHHFSAEINESGIHFIGNNDFFRSKYKTEISRIIDIVNG